MPKYDFRTPRLYVDAALGRGIAVPLDREQSHYLGNVLRLKPGAPLLLFNGRDGEWQASLGLVIKRAAAAVPEERVRPQPAQPDLHYLFAPLKHARLDYMVQKAVEMGVSRLQPVLTTHTQVARVNEERMRANVIEAAQQCGILTVAEVVPPIRFERAVEELDPSRLLVFCDEAADVADPMAALLEGLRRSGAASPPLAVAIGPEGGFSADERALLGRRPNTVRIALGPRILRADTAAVAALALIQAALGDWRAVSGDSVP